MIELLQSHGIEVRALARIERGELVPTTRALEAAERRTTQQDRSWMTPQIGVPFQSRRLKRSVRDLKTLSESVVPSRAIRFVRNGIATLEYGIQPKKIIRKNREEARALAPLIDQVLGAIDNPNVTDDDFPSFIGQIVEDILVFDAGCWEYVEKPSFVVGNPYLGLEPVPGYSMAQKVDWNGDPKEPRWAQITEDGNIKVDLLLDKDIEYLSMRKRSWTPFGLSPLETVIDIMDAWLNLASYQRRTASEAYPPFLLSLGEQSGGDQIEIMRSWWDNQVKGQGSPGMFSGFKDSKVLDLKPSGDERLYLQYQEMLIRTVAYSFGLKPLDVGIERDVNRSTAEVQRVQSLAEGIKSIAQFVASKINQRVLPRLAKILNKPDILKLEFFWMNLNPADGAVQATMYDTYVKDGVMFQDEVRAELDLEPRSDGLGMMDFNQQIQLYSLDPTWKPGKDKAQPEPDDSETKLAIQDVKKVAAQGIGRLEDGLRQINSEVEQIQTGQQKAFEAAASAPKQAPVAGNSITVHTASDFPQIEIEASPTKAGLRKHIDVVQAAINKLEAQKYEVENQVDELEALEVPLPKLGRKVERNEKEHPVRMVEYDTETGAVLKAWKIKCDDDGHILEVSEE